MYKKLTLSALSIVCISLFFTFLATKKNSIEEEKEVSGAFESLTFFGDSRSYPAKQLPANAHFDAWQAARNLFLEEKNSSRSVGPWETMGPHNRGGRTLALAFNPLNVNTLYAGSASGGLWRSHSAGVGKNAWERVTTGFPVLAVSSIAFQPGDSMQMFIGTGEVYNYYAAGTGAAYRNTRGSYGIGILKTADGGQTWHKSLDFSYDQNKGIWAIQIAPSNPNIVYAGTTDGVYKSSDNGSSWDLVLDVPMANDLAVHPTDPDLVVVGCGNFSSPGFGIYRTTDGGNFWYKITENLPTDFKGKIQLGKAPFAPNTIYASIGNGFSSAEGASWLCRSDDFGANWTIKTTTDYSQHQGWFSHDVAVNPQNAEELIAIGIEVWKSTNGGSTIELKNIGGVGNANPPIEGPDGPSNYVHSDCHDVVWHPTQPNVFYVANDGGIHRSTDGGQTFSSCNGRYQTAQFYNGFSNSATDKTFCLGGLQDNGSIQWNPEIDPTTGKAVTWTRQFGGDGSWSGINQQDDGTSYVSWQNLNVQRSVNGSNYSGLSIPKQGAIAFIAPFVLAPSDGKTIYAGSSSIAKTTDGGDSWTTTNNGLMLDGNPALSMSISSQNTQVVYTATAPFNGNPGHVFVTKNGGNTWQDVTGDLPDRFAMDLEVDPTNDAIAYVAFSGFGSGHVFRTTDYGESWADISAGLPDVPTNAVAVDPLFPNNIYVGNDLGVFSSIDNGETWQAFHDGLAEAVMVFDLKISPANRKLRAATHGLGAFQRDLLDEPFVSSTKNLGRVDFKIDVFPNPAVSQVTLKLQEPLSQNASVEIWDISGKPLQKHTLAKGQLELRISVRELPAGTYFTRVCAGSRLSIKKLVVKK